MRAWPSPEVPAPARSPAPARRASTTPRPARLVDDPARRPGPAVRLRHHAVRRHPHRPRRDVRRLRPAQPGLAQRRPRGDATSRTSPTSTTRCSSAPPKVDVDWVELAERETAAVPRGHDGAAGAPAGRTTSAPSSRSRWSIELIAAAATRPARSTDVDDDLYFSVDRRPRLRRGLRPGPRRDAARSSPSAAATPTAPARRTRSTACCGAPSAGRAVLGQPVRPRPPGLAHRVHRDRAASTSAPRSTSRAAAATWSSRTTRCRAGQAQVAHPGERRSRRPTPTPAWSAYDGEKMSKSKGNLVFVSALRASERRPDGDPAGAAAPPLPQRLGVDRRPSSGTPSTRSPPGASALALGAGAPAGPGRRARSSPRWPTTSTPRPRSPRSTAWVAATLGDRPASPTPPTRRRGRGRTPAAGRRARASRSERRLSPRRRGA